MMMMMYIKREKELETSIQIINIYTWDIEMKLGIQICPKLIMKRRMRNNSRNRTANSEKHQKTWRKGKLHVFGNIGSGHHQTKIEKRIRKEYCKTTRKLVETKLYCRNLIKETNTQSVSFVRYSELFFKWIREELSQKKQRTRKLMTIH